MKKPWEEHWTLGVFRLGDQRRPSIQFNEGVSVSLMKETYAIRPWTEFDITPHATLMAAAPELYRALERLQYAATETSFQDDGDGHFDEMSRETNRCPSCHQLDPDVYPNSTGHYDHCFIGQALKKARGE